MRENSCIYTYIYIYIYIWPYLCNPVCNLCVTLTQPRSSAFFGHSGWSKYRSPPGHSDGLTSCSLDDVISGRNPSIFPLLHPIKWYHWWLDNETKEKYKKNLTKSENLKSNLILKEILLCIVVLSVEGHMKAVLHW